MKKFVKIFLLWFILGIDIVYAEDFSITSSRVILYNMNDQDILYELNSNEQTQIASLTKIMTTIVGIENIDALDEEVTVTKEAFLGIEEYTQMGLKVGDKITYLDLLYGIMLPSGADAANVLAISVSGSVDKFVELMNDKAKELNLSHTHFDNVIGMDSEDNYSSASDVATLLIYSLKNDTFKKVFTTRNYTIANLNLPLKSTLIGYSRSYGLDVSEITGAKSGYTDGAGLCLASTATIDGVDYLLVTIGASTKSRSNAVRDSLEIYDYYSSNYSYQTIVKKGETLKVIPVAWGKEKEYEIVAPQDVTLYLENSIRKNRIQYVYRGVEELNYHYHEKDKLGNISVMYDDTELVNYDVYLNDTIHYYHPVLYGIIIVAVVMMIWSISRIKKSSKKQKQDKKTRGKKRKKKNCKAK